MKQATTLRRPYLLAALLLFLIELFIALYVRDRFIRPYVGDFLVVILIYCFLMSFWRAAPLKVALWVLAFSFAVEVGQHFHLVDRLGLGQCEVARIVIGTGFAWEDLLAYTLGIAAVLVVEALTRSANSPPGWPGPPSRFGS